MLRVETGIYSRFLDMDEDKVVEVFHVTSIQGHEGQPLETGKWYWNNPGADEPIGPFDSEQEALNAVVD